MSKILIVAPHVDDEVVGCWSVFENKEATIDVAYLFELTPQRVEEAIFASGWMGFNAVFDLLPEQARGKYDQVYVPSRKDWHPDHKLANSLWRDQATHFYSVDMAGGKYLGETNARDKRADLDTCYNSQKELWATNAKYYLFEDIQSLDYDMRVIHGVTAGAFEYKITVPCGVTVASLHSPDRIYPKEMMSKVLALCPYGKVTVELENLIMESN